MSKLFLDPALFATLVHLLRGRAEAQPQQRAYIFLLDGEADEHHLTYAELDRRARAIAAWLQQNAHPGDRVLLLYPPGLEYIAAFFGCLYAGCIAVPAYPPNPARLERTMPLLEAIPLTPNGKLDRQALPAPHQSRSELAAAFVAPRDELERHLVEIWEQLLDARPIGAADDFFELGGSSILAVRLMARIQQDYDVQLPLATLFQGGTIGDLAALLRERRGASASTALVGIQTEGARRPFFCIHPGGGHVMAYYNLAHRLGPDQPFYALQSVGLDGAEDPLTSFEAMAARYIRELRGIQPEGPYLIGGWCTGGRIATEVARQLTAQGQEVALLALLDATPILSHLPLDIETADDASLLGTMSPALHAIEQALPAMPAAERLAALVEQGRAAGLLPADVDLRYILMILRVYRANLRAERRFVPADYPGRAVLFRAARQPEGALPDLGWGVFIKPGLEVADIPGDHFSMFEDAEDVQALAERLNAYLAQAAGQ